MMEKLDAAFDKWIGDSPPEEEIMEMLDLLRKQKENTFRELKDIRNHERDEVASLQERLKLLRGEEEGKSTTDSSTGETPCKKALNNLNLKRSIAFDNITKTEKEPENTKLERGDSELLMKIVKVVFDFVREEQQTQIGKITDLLHIDERDKGGIHDLQRSLGYDIEKALLKTFIEDIWLEKIYKPYTSTSTSSSTYLIRVKDEVHDTMKDFIEACIQLVWLMLLETPPLEFCWDISKSQYRYANGVIGHFHPNDRIIYPAIALRQPNGKMKNVNLGMLQQEPS